MRTTITCPTDNCGREHGLYYIEDVDGKKTLNYLCDRVPTLVETKLKKETHLLTRVRQVEFVEGLPVRTEWKHAKVKKVQGEKQFQLPMANETL